MKLPAAATALVLISVGCSGNAGIEQEPVSVKTVLLIPERIERTLEFSARLEAGREAFLFPPAGVVEQVLVSEGDMVSPGQLLVRLSGDMTARSAESAAMAGMQAAASAAELALRNYERSLELFNAGALSESDLNGALVRRDAAAASLIGARAGYTAAAAGVDAGLLVAPFEGRVGMVRASEGSMTNPSTPLLSVIGDGLVARLLVPERHLLEIRPGMKARFTPWLAEYHSLEGIVASCAASVDPLTALVSVTVDFTAPGMVSAPVGLNGTLVIVTESAEDAMVIPLPTVTLVEESLRVPVLVDGAVEFREVTTGIRAGDSIQITSGLGFGDAVIIEAPVSLEQGLSVIETAP